MTIQTLPCSPHRSRIYLVLIAALFIVPLAAAWILAGHWRPAPTASHGELLDPAQPLTHFQMRQPDGRALGTAYLRGHWTLVYLHDASAGCDAACRRSLYGTRQARLALGKDMGRVQRLFLTSAAAEGELLAWLGAEHPGMAVGLADPATRAFLVRAFPRPGAGRAWIYLIDPLGNLVLRYDGASDPKGILEDLRRLLKLSKIG